MRIRWAGATLALLVLGCTGRAPHEAPATVPEATASDPFALVAEVDRMAALDLWPGFDPERVPLAIFDGERTLLFRHPAPPELFEPVPGHTHVWAFPGRHPQVVANSAIELGGAWTATLLPGTAGVPIRARAALLVHEAFHVFQRERHPDWSANEAELFTYPVDDPQLLMLRRLELQAIRNALASNQKDEAAGWARAALGLRDERFTTLPPGSVAYERLTELNEGLATYVEFRATGDPYPPAAPAEELAPDAVRVGAYRTGLALALLLDRFSPSWRATLESGPTVPLDVLLSSSLRSNGTGSAAGFSDAELAAARARALSAVDALVGERIEQKRRFLEQPGWRVVVVAEKHPLFPQGFDPLNVRVVADGEMLHTRFVNLGNSVGSVEILGRPALTEAAGHHPLFNGIRSVTLTGIGDEPLVSIEDDLLTLSADGLRVEARGATVERGAGILLLRFPAAN
jgi:hypothetical protein